MAEGESTSASSVQPPTVVEHDGWELTSSRINQPTKEQALAALSSETPPPETVAPPAGETETTVEAPASGATTETPEAPPKKKKSASERDAEIRARIAAETRAYHDARRAREWEEQETQRLRKEREALATPEAKRAGTTSAPAASGATDDIKPEWSKYEAEDKSYDEFLDARDAWNRKQIQKDLAAERQAAQAAVEARQQDEARIQMDTQYETRLQDAIERYPDLLATVEKNLSDIPDSPFVNAVVKGHELGTEVLWHLAQHPDEARILTTLDPSRYIRDAVRISKTPVQLLSYFAQNPQEFDRLNRLHPASALVALGELQAQFKGAKDGSPGTGTISNARPPIRPVGGTRTSAASKDPNDVPFGPDWIRAENARERERRKHAHL